MWNCLSEVNHSQILNRRKKFMTVNSDEGHHKNPTFNLVLHEIARKRKIELTFSNKGLTSGKFVELIDTCVVSGFTNQNQSSAFEVLIYI